jgi:hypothetical protein
MVKLYEWEELGDDAKRIAVWEFVDLAVDTLNKKESIPLCQMEGDEWTEEFIYRCEVFSKMSKSDGLKRMLQRKYNFNEDGIIIDIAGEALIDQSLHPNSNAYRIALCMKY